MGSGRGGARPGAGRPRKPLAEKILEGYPGKRKPKVLDMPNMEIPELKPPEYLESYELSGVDDPSVESIYKNLADWLESAGCLHLVNSILITEFALLIRRWFECEHTGSKAIVYKDPGEPHRLITNPALDLGLKYQKAAHTIWLTIWDIVAQNSEKYYGDEPENEIMLRLLNNKPAR